MRFNLPEIPPPQLITTLRAHDLLPAIVFVPSRRKCDAAATEVALDPTFQADRGKQDARLQLYNDYVKDFPEVKRHKHKKIMLKGGVASHHAGHIPSWKLLIEKMMSNGLLNAIFATSTVAAGVDFPARSVVVAHADTRGNDGWRNILASELQQMTGRAGRRGRDNVGFVILAPSRFQNPPQIAELLESPPDPLESKFRSTYTNLLNLLDAFGGFGQVRAIAEKSFAFRNTGKQIAKLNKRLRDREAVITNALADSDLNLALEDVRGYERLKSVRDHVSKTLPVTAAELRLRWLRSRVKEGRVISKGETGKRLLLVLHRYGDSITAMKENGQGVTFALPQVKRVFENRYPVRDESIDDAFQDVFEGRNPLIGEPVFTDQRDGIDEALALVDGAFEKLLGDNDEHTALKFFRRSSKDARFLQNTEREIANLRKSIWEPFENRARVLDSFGYLDFTGQQVTESGKWLADLRLDRPLLVGEALRIGVFADSTVPVVCGFMAALAADAERDYGELKLSGKLIKTITDFEEVVYNVAKVEWKNGVEPAEEINFSAAATAEAWAGGIEWDELVFRTRAEEGDLVRLLSRTGEALMQIAHLHESNPQSAKTAREAADVILREPIR